MAEQRTPTRPAAGPGPRQPTAVHHEVQPHAQLNATPTQRPNDPLAITPVSPYQVNLEGQLTEMFRDTTQSPILLCLGQKGGGKSFRTMTLLMWLLRNNVFDQYFLVLPTFHYEACNSYAWLKPFADRVFVCKEYTPEISQAFLDRRDETVPPHEIPRTFLWLDDVGMNEEFRNDRAFVGLLSVARHKRLSVCLCYHSLTSGHTLSPFLRQNVTHTLVFRVTNEKLLESIYEELISMTGHFPRFRDFKQVYNQHTCSSVNAATGEIKKNFNGICINNAIGCLDWNLGEWFPQETYLLKTFLEGMKTAMDAEELPAPDEKQNIKPVEPEMVEDVHGATPDIHHHRTVPITAQNWQILRDVAKKPTTLFQISNPVHLLKQRHAQRHRPRLTPRAFARR